MRRLVLKGTVFSGKGEGTRYVSFPWVRKQMEEKLGFTPFHGTLNVRIAPENVAKLKMLEKAKVIEISPQEGFSRGKCFKALLMNSVKCAVVIPEVAGYPENVLELVAPANLRNLLHIKDNDTVDITIML